MKKMRLIVHDFESYCDGFALWGVIYVNMCDQCFPDGQWRDASSSILEMWASNITCMINGTTDKCTLYFMDGDYRIELLSVQRDEANAKCVGPGNKVAFSSTVDLFHFARQILAAVERMKLFCSEHLDSKAFHKLTYETSKLRNSLRKHS